MRRSQFRETMLAFGLSIIFLSGRCDRATECQQVGSIAGHKVLRAFSGTDNGGAGLSLAVSAALFEDRGGTYWAGVPLGVYSYDENTDRWKPALSSSGKHIAPSARVICQSGDGKLWFHSALFHSLTAYQNGQWESVDRLGAFSTQPSAVLLTASSGRVWIAQQRGLFCYDNDHWNDPVGIPDNVGMQPKPHRPGRPVSSTPLPKVRTTPDIAVGIEGHDGTLWMGTQTTILAFKPPTNEWLAYPLPEGFVGVFIIHEDPSGRIWFADTEGHVSAYDRSRDTWSKTYDVMKHIPGSGLLSSSPQFAITAICQDTAGVMIFGSFLGLIRLEEARDQWSIFTVENSALPDDSITSIMRDGRGRIWLGTGKGLVLLRE